MPKPNISICQDVGMWQILSVGGVRSTSLVVSVAGVRVVEFGSVEIRRGDNCSICCIKASQCVTCCRVVPLGIPHSTQQEAQLCGYTIPCETVVICNHQAVHLNETSWNNPCEFDPERFLDEDCEQPRLLRCINNFLPFGLGMLGLVSLSLSLSLF